MFASPRVDEDRRHVYAATLSGGLIAVNAVSGACLGCHRRIGKFGMGGQEHAVERKTREGEKIEEEMWRKRERKWQGRLLEKEEKTRGKGG